MKPKQHLQKMWKLTAIATAILVSATTLAVAQESAVVQKKLIEAGWDAPDTASLRKNISQIESSPFDGVVIWAIGKDEAGKDVSLFHAFSATPWKQEWFQSSVDDLKAIHSAKLADSFINIGSIPGHVDWFDDAGWKQVVDHWRIAAWIAKEGNLKGICFDPEEYGGGQFDYRAQPEYEKHSYAEYYAKARQRGREVIQAVAGVDPNLMIFTYFMSSLTNAAEAPDPSMAIYDGLYPSFIDGWLDAAPPSMVFVDGCEAAYPFNSQLEYLKAANFIHNTELNLVAPENRAKYVAQVQTSFGMYLDAYTNPSTSSWYIDPKGSTPTRRLQVNTGFALDAASEYVWVYGEKYRWWDTSNKSVNPQSWEDVLPGIHDALLAITHPHQLAGQQVAALEKSGSLVNLLTNGDFSAAPVVQDAAKVPASWDHWQSQASHGTFTQDDSVNHSGSMGGSGRLTGVLNGCFLQSVAVKPGQTYIVQGWIRQTAQGPSIIRIQMKNMDDIVLYFNTQTSTKDGWQKVQTVVTAPEGAEDMRLLLGTSPLASPQDVVWFDDISVYKIN